MQSKGLRSGIRSRSAGWQIGKDHILRGYTYRAGIRSKRVVHRAAQILLGTTTNGMSMLYEATAWPTTSLEARGDGLLRKSLRSQCPHALRLRYTSSACCEDQWREWSAKPGHRGMAVVHVAPAPPVTLQGGCCRIGTCVSHEQLGADAGVFEPAIPCASQHCENTRHRSMLACP